MELISQTFEAIIKTFLLSQNQSLMKCRNKHIIVNYFADSTDGIVVYKRSDINLFLFLERLEVYILKF